MKLVRKVRHMRRRFMGFKRHDDFDASAFAHPAPYHQVPPNALSAFAKDLQPGLVVPYLPLYAAAIILNSKAQVRRLELEFDQHVARPRMLDYVGQCFLGDPEKVVFDFRRHGTRFTGC